MAEESKKDSIRNSTLHTLVKHIGLTPQEVAQLRLSDLHLAGKNPNIKFTRPDSDEPKTIDLDLDAHRALVGWLVARPDSTSDYLFPGQDAEPLTGQQIEQLIADVDQAPETPPQPKPSAGQTAAAAGAASAGSAPPAGTPPPRSAPELGAPPPGMTPLGANFTPPPTAPESDEPVSMPLPSSAPPPRPPEPMKPPESDQPAKKAASTPVAPIAAGAAAAAAKESAKSDAARPTTTSSTGTPAQIKAKQTSAKQSSRWPRIAIVATAIVLVLLCAGCLASGWFVSQSETGGQLLARLGIVGTVMPLDDADIIASLTPPPTNTPQPTPTLPPTSTATATDTPIPTDTPTPTDTLLPTDTPLPAETPTDTPVPDTPTPETPPETPTPEATPTPSMIYPAPTLLEPEDGMRFIVGNIIVLRWQPVGELASDEQYAVRLVYQFENQPTYQGTNLRETEWEVPASLYGQIDGPENLYEWFVVVERLNDDGSGTAISPESQHRNFTWK